MGVIHKQRTPRIPRQVELTFRTHGGKRAGAGRPPRGRKAGPRHAARPAHDARHPVHVTLRVLGNVGNLRRRDTYLAIRETTIVTAVRREDFRIVHLSIQRDHLHLIVEADDKAALANGVRGFEISAARQINKSIHERGCDRRTGKVFAARYHARALTSPRAVRSAVAYCLGNWRHHGEDLGGVSQTWTVDPFSSGATFPGWRELADSPFLWPLRDTYQPLIVFRPRTWLLTHWDRFHAAISAWDVPGGGGGEGEAP